MPQSWATWTDVWNGALRLWEASPPLGSPAWVAMVVVGLLCLLVVVSIAMLEPPMAHKLRARPCPPPPPMPSAPNTHSARSASEAGPTSPRHHVNLVTLWPTEQEQRMLFRFAQALPDGIRPHPQHPDRHSRPQRRWTRLLGQQDMFRFTVIHN